MHHTGVHCSVTTVHMTDVYRRPRYTDDKTVVVDEDGDEYVVERTSTAPVSAAYPWGAYYVLGFLCFFIVLIILAVFFFSYWGWGTTQNTMNIQSLNTRLAAQHHSDFETEGLYSLAQTLQSRQPQTLALCHMGLYAATTASGVGLQPVRDTTTHLGEQQQHHSDVFYYVVKSRFALHFNVDAARADAYGFDLSRLSRAADERYQMIHYEIASSYTDFSTIKLVESELDLSKRSLRVKREFIACSNNPLLAVKRCGNLIDGRLVMNNTRLEPMDVAHKEKKNKTGDANLSTATTTKQQTPPATKATVVATEEGIDLTPEHQESLRALKSEISHVRLYHVVCYKSETPLNRDDETFRETVLLRIELNKC